MTRPPLTVLEDIRFATPCNVSWDSMQGDDRVRHCARCSLDVYNISAMNKEEALSFLNERAGRTCGVLWKRADGTVLTADCEAGYVEPMMGEIEWVPEPEKKEEP